MKFIITILIIIGAWYALGFLGRLLFPFLMKRFTKRMMGNFGYEDQQKNYEEEKQKEGEVKIDYKTKNKNKKDNSKGEYIDFEELD